MGKKSVAGGGSMDFSTGFGSPEFATGWDKPETVKNGNFIRRTIDSFKRDSNRVVSYKGAIGADGKVFDAEGAAQATATSPLARRLKGRHLQMIAIGGSIGTNTT
jgi:amino acid transporter